MKTLHIGLSATPNTNNGLQKAWKKVGEYREIHTSHPHLNSQIIADCKDFKPDIVFMQLQAPNIVHTATIRAIRHNVGKIVNFTGDVRDPLPSWYIDMGKEIDHSLFVSGNDVKTAQSMGINASWMQIGFDPEIFNDQVIPATDVPEIVFMANNYHHFPLSAYRSEIAHALHKEFGNRFGLYGNGWKIPAKDCNDSQELQASILRGCKIAISCSNFNHSKYVSDRVLRIMGSGAFCLSHEFEGRGEVYDLGQEMVPFGSITEMIQLCRQFLEDNWTREYIAKNGYELTHHLYTWDCMINNIIELCK